MFDAGYRCESCADGYYEDIAASSDGAEWRDHEARECVRCRCNNNIDSNAVGNCDRCATLCGAYTVDVSE